MRIIGFSTPKIVRALVAVNQSGNTTRFVGANAVATPFCAASMHEGGG